MKYRIKDWREHQHYSKRNPPWIKLHFRLLSDPEWVSLDDASRVLAIACMLLASRTNGDIDGSPQGLTYLKRVAYLNKHPNLNPLISCGFLVPLANASTMLADASISVSVSSLSVSEDKGCGEKGKRATLKPLPPDFTISESVRVWANAKGYDHLDEHLDHFKDTAVAKGYRYVDWDAAFRRAVRDNWAKIIADDEFHPFPTEFDAEGNPIGSRYART